MQLDYDKEEEPLHAAYGTMFVEEWNCVEVPSCRGSSQWINGCVDNRSGFGEEDDSNTGEVGEKERTCAGVHCAVRRKVKHDAWMNDPFWGRNSNLCHAHMSSVLCDLCNDCTCENVACGRCICPHPASIAREFTFRQAKKSISELKKNTTVQSRMGIAKNSNFCSTSNRRVVPTDLTRTNVLDAATGFPVTSKDRSSILFGHRFDNHILQVFRIVGFFVVWIVVQDEWVYFLLKSLSHVHHAVFSFFNEIRSLIHWSFNTFFIQLECPTFLVSSSFLSCCNIGVVCQCKFVILNNLLFSHLISDKDLRYVSSLCHLSKMVCTHHAWVGELSAASPWLCSTLVAGIDKASKFFLSNFLVLCEDLRHLPDEQYTMPISKYKLQSGHCLGRGFRRSRYCPCR